MPDMIPAPPPDASASRRGLINTVAQAFAGIKTFAAGIVLGAKLRYSGSDAFTIESGTADVDGNSAFVFRTTALAAGRAAQDLMRFVDTQGTIRVRIRSDGWFESTYLHATGYVYSALLTNLANNVPLRLTSRRANAATAVALSLEAEVPLTTAGAKIVRVLNGAEEKFAIDKDGGLLSPGVVKSQVPDGADIVSHVLDTAGPIAGFGAKLLSLRNNGVERASLGRAGDFKAERLTSGIGGVYLEADGIHFPDGSAQFRAAGQALGGRVWLDSNSLVFNSSDGEIVIPFNSVAQFGNFPPNTGFIGDSVFVAPYEGLYHLSPILNIEGGGDPTRVRVTFYVDDEALNDTRGFEFDIPPGERRAISFSIAIPLWDSNVLDLRIEELNGEGIELLADQSVFSVHYLGGL